jgi:hypothetical protein
MKTFDYEQVRAVLSPLKAKLQDCAHGEGNRCETLDNHLDCCARICTEVYTAVVAWAQDVFAGRVAFDPEAETLWRAEVTQIYAQAKRAWRAGKRAEVPCWDLPGQSRLEAVLWHLNDLLDGWVTPKLAASPSARVTVRPDDAESATVRRQLAELPPPDGKRYRILARRAT